eukprot:1764411-Pleurochrysis_carterae.AAC.2
MGGRPLAQLLSGCCVSERLLDKTHSFSGCGTDIHECEAVRLEADCMAYTFVDSVRSTATLWRCCCDQINCPPGLRLRRRSKSAGLKRGSYVCTFKRGP